MNKKILKISFLSLSLIITLIITFTICSAYFDKSNAIETNQEILGVNYQAELITGELVNGRGNLTDEERKESSKKQTIEVYERIIKEAKEKNNDLDEETINLIYDLMQQALDSIDEE